MQLANFVAVAGLVDVAVFEVVEVAALAVVEVAFFEVGASALGRAEGAVVGAAARLVARVGVVRGEGFGGKRTVRDSAGVAGSMKAATDGVAFGDDADGFTLGCPDGASLADVTTTSGWSGRRLPMTPRAPTAATASPSAHLRSPRRQAMTAGMATSHSPRVTTPRMMCNHHPFFRPAELEGDDEDEDEGSANLLSRR